MIAFWRRLRPRRPVYVLGPPPTAIALPGPAVRPWYVLWGLFLIAAAAPNGSVRLRRAAAAASGVPALAVPPSRSAQDRPHVSLTAGGAAAALVLRCDHRSTARGSSGPCRRTELLGSPA
ncbi:hypothetical protein [Streptomyces sp. NPDC127084]|uniref:hypothetical protein n=1 Tax=Streptomyces sp. NPDC127084 TaxID=3347133 RepID=UPI003646B7E6